MLGMNSVWIWKRWIRLAMPSLLVPVVPNKSTWGQSALVLQAQEAGHVFSQLKGSCLLVMSACGCCHHMGYIVGTTYPEHYCYITRQEGHLHFDHWQRHLPPLDREKEAEMGPKTTRVRLTVTSLPVCVPRRGGSRKCLGKFTQQLNPLREWSLEPVLLQTMFHSKYDSTLGAWSKAH